MPKTSPSEEDPVVTRPTVSVVMASHNAAPYIGAAIATVLGQSLSDLELIISDDGSTDGTVAVANGAAVRDPRVRVLEHATPTGPGAARNRALKVARGHWVAIVDADDLLHPLRFERMLADADEADVVADDLVRFGAQDGQRLLEGLALEAPWTPDAHDLLAAELADPPVPVGYLKPIIRATALAGLSYCEEMTVGEDLDLLLRVALSGARVKIVPEGYYLYRRHPGSTSHRLSAGDVAGMAVAAADLLAHAGVTPKIRDLIGSWCERLDHQHAFAQLLGDLKAGRMLSAGQTMARKPDLWSDLQLSVREGLARRLKGKGAPRGRAPISLPQDADASTPAAAARIVALTGHGTARLRVEGRAGLEALCFVPGWTEAELIAPKGGWSAREASVIAALPWPVSMQPLEVNDRLVHVRTPTYRRPQGLRRALQSLVDQTHQDWICDVFDDDPEGSAYGVVRALADPRVRYHHVATRLFAAGNINRCFSRANPHGAAYFCMLDDDSMLFSTYLSENIRVAQAHDVQLVFRNQRVEHNPGTAHASLSRGGLLDKRLTERVYGADHFRLAIIADVGVSNGGLFWSHKAQSDLQVRTSCSVTLQEYYRTMAIQEPILVAMDPLRTWADNGSQSRRDEGQAEGWLRRELVLKATVARLRREVWQTAPKPLRAGYLEDDAFSYPRAERARGLVKSGLRLSVGGALSPLEIARLAAVGAVIRVFGWTGVRRISGLVRGR
ncbi:MAG: glycosyltransferase family 2 protein [Pseudomonadota bacterium]